MFFLFIYLISRLNGNYPMLYKDENKKSKIFERKCLVIHKVTEYYSFLYDLRINLWLFGIIQFYSFGVFILKCFFFLSSEQTEKCKFLIRMLSELK